MRAKAPNARRRGQRVASLSRQPSGWGERMTSRLAVGNGLAIREPRSETRKSCGEEPVDRCVAVAGAVNRKRPMQGHLVFDAGADAWSDFLNATLRYPIAQVDSLPDGVTGVYRDQAHNQCLCVIVPGARGQSKLLETAQRHSAEFVAAGSPQKYELFHVGPYALSRCAEDRLPSWVPAIKRTELLSKDLVLLPFRDEEQLRRAFGACHDAIFIDSAKDPAAAFDLLSLVIVSKVMDEQRQGSRYLFGEVVGEGELEIRVRLTKLLNDARRWLIGQDLADDEVRTVPNLRASVMTVILRQLQDFSLTLTGASPRGTDLLGVAYEHLVGATFRGELGSYFTPRNIADFMVRLIDAREGTIFDPSCGSGGLLIAAHRLAHSEGKKPRALDLYGNDLNPRMVEAAKANFLVHALDPGHVLHGDGLDLSRMTAQWFKSGRSHQATVTPIWDGPPGPFDVVLANPPFAGHEKDPEILKHFSSAFREDGSVRSLNKTLPFLELIVASLKEGGRAGIVLPTSILNAEEDSFQRFRELLLQHAELLAIIGLPEKAFVHTDCGVHGALLFFKRSHKPRENYPIFVAWADQLGYDRLGKPTRTSSFPEIAAMFHRDQWPAEHQVFAKDLLAYGRWDPTWLRVARNLPADDESHVTLDQLVEVRNARWSRTQLQDDGEYRYFEVVDADIHTGRVDKVHTASGFELAKKGRIRNLVRAGDVLLPTHRDSLMATSAPNGRAVVLVDDVLDGVLTTDRFMILRPKIDPTLLVAILNSRGIRRQLVAQSRGAASLDIREHTLAKVLVPKSLLSSKKAAVVVKLRAEMLERRAQFEAVTSELSRVVEGEFGGDGDAPIRPPAAVNG